MIRAAHRWPGLLAAVLLTVLALTGAGLSVFPVLDRLGAPQAGADLSVADLARRVQTVYPGVEEIKRAPSGRITAYWFANGVPGSAVIDPATGRGVASADPNPGERWLTSLHRSLFLGDVGRYATAVAAAAMLILSVSGVPLVLRRVGGWRRWFSRLRGPLAGRLHLELARIAVAGLLLSSATALYMTASTFDLLPAGGISATGAAPSGQVGTAPGDMDLLRKTPVSAFRELDFPSPDDPTDTYTLMTDRGTGTLDPETGALLGWTGLSRWDRVTETVYMLHTGQGAAVLGLVLGLMALAVPAMGATGVAVWLAGLRARPRIRGNAAAGSAETILLVGSESGSTWGFAATLHAALTEAGQSVHVAALSAYDPARYARVQRFVIMAATYGDGAAPASATGFLDRLAAQPKPEAPVAVLGFGDRSFPDFCAYAQAVADAAATKGWTALLPLDTVDRQSPQDFARWGRLLGDALNVPLELVHQPVMPALHTLTLISRRDHGAEVQSPTSILRFALPQGSLWQRMTSAALQRFEAGDLLGILPQGATVPRLYSLASGSRDGFVEIVVKKQPGGLASGKLVALEPGDRVVAFLRRNPDFHAGRGRAPLILIGAGTGIGPLAGFVRANRRRRPIVLFFGMRHAESDYLYASDLAGWKGEGRLMRLFTAVSRGAHPLYVQHALRAEAAQVAQMIHDGARVMVCGGRDMAAGVAEVLADVLAPAGLTPAMLKAAGRYVEDVY